MIKKIKGFTLIELVIFIVITSILASTILLSFNTALQKTPVSRENNIAAQTVKKCMEWYIGQRQLNGFSSISTGTTVPSFCTAPAGYTVTVNVATTTYNGDNNYKTITVTVNGPSGIGSRDSANTLIADY